ncbi:Hypothetical protein FKW44_019542 [Caligus rogercresseyi]|uniref:Uncharacterized protein n=1 Tax=Caligus rogercresseyi TaxID=217165 RepID=A0A7T8JYH5_CALRO|nr:Hypothetical protein FKW44_019542 [Caligus rogercresseyi]
MRVQDCYPIVVLCECSKPLNPETCVYFYSASHESFGAEVHISKNVRGRPHLPQEKGEQADRPLLLVLEMPRRIHTILDPMDGEEIRIQKTLKFHNHPPNESALFKHSFYQDLKAVSLARPELSSSALVKEALGDMDEASLSQLPPFTAGETRSAMEKGSLHRGNPFIKQYAWV